MDNFTNVAFDLLRKAESELRKKHELDKPIIKARVVGGYVRDHILNLPNKDIDVVIEGPFGPQLAECFSTVAKTHLGDDLVGNPVIFERFGTAQVRIGDEQIEFVSARSESYSENSRKPEVKLASLEEDMLRRDFTINALSMKFNGEIEDVLGKGLVDLKNKILRTPLDPVQTFSDDPLRMLRAIRFAVKLDFQLEESLLPAMRQLKHRLESSALSVERINEELRKMLISNNPRRAIELLDKAEFLPVLFPELEKCKGVSQNKFHTEEVYTHILSVLEKTPADLPTRLAALFHDQGKPATKTIDYNVKTGDNEIHFYGHEDISAEICKTRMSALKFSNDEIAQVSRLVQMHMRPVFYSPEWSDGTVRRLARDIQEDKDRLIDHVKADILSSAHPDIALTEELEHRLEKAFSEPEKLGVILPINGEDIMEIFDLKPGPQIKFYKELVSDKVTDNEVEPTREALLAFLISYRDSQPKAEKDSAQAGLV